MSDDHYVAIEAARKRCDDAARALAAAEAEIRAARSKGRPGPPPHVLAACEYEKREAELAYLILVHR